jgi:hypothetical protein
MIEIETGPLARYYTRSAEAVPRYLGNSNPVFFSITSMKCVPTLSTDIPVITTGGVFAAGFRGQN